jgi:TetR/AcrR family transcriptional regulator, transcriptional repressor for nem operon
VAEPKTARGRERKSAIVGAAAALMYERGVRAVGVDEVLAASGAGKSQFYHYFSNKDELVAAVLEHQLAVVLGELGQFRLDSWRGLRAWFDALLRGQQQRGFNGCPVGSLAVELSASGADMQRRVEQAFARWEDALADALESMKAGGALHPSARSAALAQTTLAAIQGGYLLSTAHHNIRPMQTSLSAAYTHLRANRPTP